MTNPYNPEEDELVRNNWFERKEKSIEQLPNRSWSSIRGRARKLGLPRRSQRWWPNSKPIALTEFEKGFITALIDGEGSLVIHKCRRNPEKYQCLKNFTLTPEITIGNTDKSFLEKAQQMIGGYITRGPKRKNPKHKQRFDLRITGLNNIFRLLRAIESNLTVKRNQCKLMLEYCRSRMDAIKNKGTWKSHYCERELESYTEMKMLNSGEEV